MKALHDREEHIEHCLLEAEQARNEAERLMAENQKNLARAAEQVRAMLDEARKGAEETANSIVQRAQAEAEASRERAEREIGTAKDQALAEIFSRTADLAVAVAGKVLARDLSEADHRRLVEAAMAELPAMANGRGARGHDDRPHPTPTRSPAPSSTRRPPRSTRSYADALLKAAVGERRRGRRSTSSSEIVADVVRRPAPVRRADPRSPSLASADRDRMLVDVFGGRAAPTVVNFLRVLNRHGRLGLLAPIVRQARARLGPQAGPPAGDGPLGRPARRRPAGRARGPARRA